MFEQGAVPGRVDADAYGAEFEDFSKEALELDIWVFDKVKKLFEDAKTNATLDAQLRKEQNVFFLHLLGLDTAGHSHRPYSKQYLNNIKVVDQGVQEITELIEDFYRDGKTAFVFTADHGMSDWGSHGDGHPDNTRTPLIVWGSGVSKPIINTTGIAKGHEDGFSSDWGLDHIQRHDVAQADVAALMAYLVGLAFPVNSVGELPLTYLDTDSKSKAEALLVNAKEILEMYHVKEEQKKSSELRYEPFSGFGDETHSVEHRVSYIQELIDQGKADEAIQHTNDLIQLAIQGLRYLQTYDWLFLRTLVTAGYVGWIVYAITIVIDLHVLNEETITSRTLPSMITFASILVALYSILFAQSSPAVYYAYAFFPVMFWEEIWASRTALTKGCKILFGHVSSPTDIFKLVISVLGFFGVLEALVSIKLSTSRHSADDVTGAKLLPPRNLHYLLPSRNHLAGFLRHGFHEAKPLDCLNLGTFMHAHECVHFAASKQDRRFESNVSVICRAFKVLNLTSFQSRWRWPDVCRWRIVLAL
jgi:phosphatidylinositol glycan class N